MKIKEFTGIGNILENLSPQILRDDTSLKMRIMTQWNTIVGNEVAAIAQPKNLTFSRHNPPQATLHLSIEGGYALQMQMMESQLLEKISVYFGYRAVHRIKILQHAKN